MASVILENVRKVYPNGYVAIEDASLTIKDGEFVTLVGPSGCGKSTLLRMIAGLEDVSDGSIRIGERIVNDMSPRDRNIAMVFQNYALYPHMSVYDNMSFALRQAKLPKREIADRVAFAADILGLEEMLGRKPKELSGGQRQRVAVGRAIVRDADVFLFDEPLSNLDASLRTQMRAEIARLHKKLGKTMIYVTHDQVEAMTMADRIVVLKDGDIIQTDSPLDIYRHPKSEFVATFIGSPAMNLFRGKVQANGGGQFSVVFGETGQRVTVDGEAAGRFEVQDGADVSLGVRPEDIHLDTTESSGEASLDIVIDLTEPMGNEVIVHGHLASIPDGSVVARGRIEPLPCIGDTLRARIDASRISLFATNEGSSLSKVMC